MGIWSNYVNDLKQEAGSLIGGAGGLISGTIGYSTPLTSKLRDVGGQLTGGARNFNLVPTVNAMENTSYNPPSNTLTNAYGLSGNQPSGQILGDKDVRNPGGGGGGGFPTGGLPTGGTPGYPGQQEGDAAAARAQAELNAALTQYDELAAEAERQRGVTTEQMGLAKGEVDTQYASAEKRAGTLTQEAEKSKNKQTEQALSTSQDVVRKNRNILRAMGILSSSAAGEMLLRPTEEYAKQAADLRTAFTERKKQVEEWLSERFVEAENAKKQITAQFNDIISKIDQDIRFNRRDKIDAVQQANAALKETIAEINSKAMAYNQAAQQYNQNMAMQIANLQLYQNPSANISGILSSLIQPQQQTQPIQVGTLSGERKDIYGNTL